MLLKYRGCTYDSSATRSQLIPSTATLIYRGVQYQRGSTAPQFATPQYRQLMYRGSIYLAC